MRIRETRKYEFGCPVAFQCAVVCQISSRSNPLSLYKNLPQGRTLSVLFKFYF
jgi:hypothetical protein